MNFKEDHFGAVWPVVTNLKQFIHHYIQSWAVYSCCFSWWKEKVAVNDTLIILFLQFFKQSLVNNSFLPYAIVSWLSELRNHQRSNINHRRSSNSVHTIVPAMPQIKNKIIVISIRALLLCGSPNPLCELPLHPYGLLKLSQVHLLLDRSQPLDGVASMCRSGSRQLLPRSLPADIRKSCSYFCCEQVFIFF